MPDRDLPLSLARSIVDYIADMSSSTGKSNDRDGSTHTTNFTPRAKTFLHQTYRDHPDKTVIPSNRPSPAVASRGLDDSSFAREHCARLLSGSVRHSVLGVHII